MHKLHLVREGLKAQILSGSIDKFGNSNYSTKCAALFTVETILGYVPSIHNQYDTLLEQRRLREEAAAKYGKDIHAGDAMTHMTDLP